MENKDILTNERLIELGFKESGKDILDRPIFRIKPPNHDILGSYPFELQIILSPTYSETNPNSGILSIHCPECEASVIPPDLMGKKEEWTGEEMERAVNFKIKLKEWTQPIAWFVTHESRLIELCSSMVGFKFIN